MGCSIKHGNVAYRSKRWALVSLAGFAPWLAAKHEAVRNGCGCWTLRLKP